VGEEVPQFSPSSDSIGTPFSWWTMTAATLEGPPSLRLPSLRSAWVIGGSHMPPLVRKPFDFDPIGL
jgi:hypothetical protein